MKLKLSCIKYLSRHQMVLMDKVFYLFLWQQWRFKMAENSHLTHLLVRWPTIFLCLTNSFVLSNKYANLKKTRITWFFLCKKIMYRMFFLNHYLNVKKSFNTKKSGVTELVCDINWIKCKLSAIFDTSPLS